MSRKRRGDMGDNDSLDLLLDTVSNVFGGVMFLTLLAALLVISRGATAIEEVTPPEVPDVDPDVPIVDDRVVQMELQQTRSAVATQEKILKTLPVQPGDLEKFEQVKSLESALRTAKENILKTSVELEQTQKKQANLQTEQADKEKDRQAKAQALAAKQEELAQAEKVGKRTIAFRPLKQSITGEAILVLRYNRVYVFQTSPQNRSYNEADFFRIGNEGSAIMITPKPHRGVLVTQSSAKEVAQKLRRNFPSHQYHITVAVWDDSFGQFNMLCDALKSMGYRYRTIPCNSEAKLSFGATDSFVQ